MLEDGEVAEEDMNAVPHDETTETQDPVTLSPISLRMLADQSSR